MIGTGSPAGTEQTAARRGGLVADVVAMGAHYRAPWQRKSARHRRAPDKWTKNLGLNVHPGREAVTDGAVAGTMGERAAGSTEVSMHRFSLGTLIAGAVLGEHRAQPQWRSPPPKSAYAAVIVGGGGHGLGTAYYLAKEHGLRDVAVLEKGWI